MKSDPKLSLTQEQCKELSQEFSIIPLFSEILLDMDTPLTAFLKLGYDRSPYSFLLESVEKGEIKGRYSFLGSNPFQVFSVKNKKGILQSLETNGGTGKKKTFTCQDPLHFLKDELSRLGKPYQDDRLPKFFGGVVGYLAYDIVRYYEKLPDKNPDKMNFPDLFFLFTRELILFDHINNRIKIIYNIFTNQNQKNIESLYTQAAERIQLLFYNLSESRVKHKFLLPSKESDVDVKSTFTKENFIRKVEKAKEYILNGDIFQVVLSNRFSFSHQFEPLNLYRALRSVNPSPYLFFYKQKKKFLIGSSPEILVRRQGQDIEIRPIAGTRKRGANELEDQRFEQDLLADEKEVAEHIMLVDLARNDIGRIAEKGTVEVRRFKYIERYSHVMHIVSACFGKIDERYSSTDVARVALPAGTLSGAPKIRAMEIIDELEEARRGYYGGSLGYISYSGDMDLAILIRTFYLEPREGLFQAGAGIVFDSDPAKEWTEVENKAAAMKQALLLASRGLKL